MSKRAIRGTILLALVLGFVGGMLGGVVIGRSGGGGRVIEMMRPGTPETRVERVSAAAQGAVPASFGKSVV